MEYLYDSDYLEPEAVWLYRTKDFRAVVHREGFEIVGAHKNAIAWLHSNKARGLREQFVNADGALIAADSHEVQALIMDLQAERAW